MASAGRDLGFVQLLTDLSDLRSRLDEALLRNRQESRRVAKSCSLLLQTTKAMEESGSSFARVAQEPEKARKPSAGGNALAKLTRREIEVLRLIADGISTKQIAVRLTISFKTAVTHRTNLMKKLGMHESASLVRLAIRHGLVQN